MGLGFLKQFAKHIEHTAISQPKAIVTDLAHGKINKAFGDWKHTFGDNERDLQKVFHKAGVRGWVGDHPQESIGALVATIFGGWAAWGAYGAGAAGSATGAAAGSAGGATAAGAGTGTITAGTAIGQTIPAIPSVASMTSGTGAAVTATPSYTVLAGAGYGTGGSYATTLGGEAAVTNTGLSSGASWMDKAKQYYDIYQKVNQATNSMSQQDQQSQWKGVAFQNNPSYQPATRDNVRAGESPVIPTTTTQILNGIDINSDINSGPFTKSGTFGGFN
ncbi:hypothetical protein INE66_003644 [Salmonella enterica subsp. enterica]|nr:hypothetical protein [Salmonella enterica subsp. enterica]